jgi:hypothetical protein
MHERIRELVQQAENHANEQNELHGVSYRRTFEQTFAELIVQECADIAIGLSKLYPRDDVGFDVGYTMGTKRAAKEIAEHFGVN